MSPHNPSVFFPRIAAVTWLTSHTIINNSRLKRLPHVRPCGRFSKSTLGNCTAEALYSSWSSFTSLPLHKTPTISQTVAVGLKHSSLCVRAQRETAFIEVERCEPLDSCSFSCCAQSRWSTLMSGGLRSDLCTNPPRYWPLDGLQLPVNQTVHLQRTGLIVRLVTRRLWVQVSVMAGNVSGGVNKTHSSTPAYVKLHSPS